MQLYPPLGFANCSAEAWAATADGKALYEREEALVDSHIAGLFGYYAIQLGDPHRNLLHSSPISTCLRVGRSGSCSVKSAAEHLPFESGSIDLVVISHLLEFVTYPQHVVREAHRVLRPEGSLIVLCFNPASIYGLWRFASVTLEYPWYGTFLAPLRLRDWFEVLGFASAGGAYVGYAYPNAGSRMRSILDKAGDRWWPVFGTSSMLHVIKRQPAVRLILPGWDKVRRRARSKATAAVETRKL